MIEDGYDERGFQVVNVASELARPSGRLEPLHLLVALSEDERASLLHHHHAAIDRSGEAAIPELTARPAGPTEGLFGISLGAHRHRHLVPPGWVCWLGNAAPGFATRGSD